MLYDGILSSTLIVNVVNINGRGTALAIRLRLPVSVSIVGTTKDSYIVLFIFSSRPTSRLTHSIVDTY